MSFFDDYDIDLNDFNSSGFDVPDGHYDFEIIGSQRRVGTSNDPDAVNITITYRLEDPTGAVFTSTQWFKVPEDPNHPTQREEISMSDLKRLLLSAGIKPEELNSAGPDDLEGLTGTLRLVTSTNKKTGKEYQNFRDITFDTQTAEASVEKPKSSPKKAPAQSTPAASNPFARG